MPAFCRLAPLLGLFFATHLTAAEAGGGLFSDYMDIGAPSRRGKVSYNEAADAYTVSGGGANMWAKADSFYYVWKKIEGDIALSADIAFVGQSKEPHRKACLIIRQTLDADSIYADVVLHGDGLTSLQFRTNVGDVTHEIQSTAVNPPSPDREEW